MVAKEFDKQNSTKSIKSTKGLFYVRKRKFLIIIIDYIN